MVKGPPKRGSGKTTGRRERTRDSAGEVGEREGEEIRECLEAGPNDILGKIDKARKETEQGTMQGYDEVEHDLMSRRDRVGYSQALLKELGFTLSPAIVGRIEDLDEAVKELLPRGDPVISRSRRFSDVPSRSLP